jgi:ATP-dependent DNA helicase RecG
MSFELPTRESLTVEFKSDRKCLGEKELLAAVVCLANCEGGQIFLGVEDDGRPTGLHKNHENVSALAAMIGNRTHPPLALSVSTAEIEGVLVARLDVPKASLVATSEGLLQKRRMGADGKPECTPFYPYQFAQRVSSIGMADHTAVAYPDATTGDFDPIEQHRLRQFVERGRADPELRSLADEELEDALNLVVSRDGRRIPTVTGLLLLGTANALRRFVPTHELAIQVLEGTDVRRNNFYREPLLRLNERAFDAYQALVRLEEVQLSRNQSLQVPSIDDAAFREAFLNALVHRDYSSQGTVYLRWDSEGLEITSPGGFVEGVTPENLLRVAPTPRNPHLATALMRLGLVERTARGVDRIYEGLLQYGRPAPDYSRSTGASVTVRLSSASPDVPFYRIVRDYTDRKGAPPPLDALIVLSKLREERRLPTEVLAAALQRKDSDVRRVVEALVEDGFVVPHGNGPGRTYTLSPDLYQQLGRPQEAYVRQAGFSPVRQEQMILTYVEQYGAVSRQDVVQMCFVSEDQATRRLRALVNDGRLVQVGRARGARYQFPARHEML